MKLFPTYFFFLFLESQNFWSDEVWAAHISAHRQISTSVSVSRKFFKITIKLLLSCRSIVYVILLGPPLLSESVSSESSVASSNSSASSTGVRPRVVRPVSVRPRTSSAGSSVRRLQSATRGADRPRWR